MDIGRIVRILVVAAILFALWKYGVPWVKKKTGGASSATATASGGSACVQSAERASETWGSGLRQFANPPYDLNAWSSFRTRVESQLNAADLECACAGESCEKARGAMRNLRGLLNDLESTIRNGSDASDFVQRQESIDSRINEAAELARAGR